MRIVSENGDIEDGAETASKYSQHHESKNSDLEAEDAKEDETSDSENTGYFAIDYPCE